MNGGRAKAFMDDDDEGLFRFLMSTIVRVYREDPRFERLLITRRWRATNWRLCITTRWRRLGAQVQGIYSPEAGRGVSGVRSRPGAFGCGGISSVLRNSEIHLPAHSDNCSDEHAVDVFMQILMDGLAPGEKRNEK